ncbi:MAG: family 10 glycosylhydrolase, partial [Myxococcota bacterium]
SDTANPRSRPPALSRAGKAFVAVLLLSCAACSPEDPGSAAPVALEGVSEPPATGPVTPRSELARDSSRAGFRGLWVLCEGSERVLEEVTRVDALVERAIALGATDLFVQVYRGGRAWYDASQADASPFEALSAGNRPDPLRALIAKAHSHRLRVHAWVNVLALARNRDAWIVRDLGPGAILVDRRGRSLLDYPAGELPAPDTAWYRMGTPGIYLDPAAPGVAERLAATFSELVSRYPELDGVHLDYIRHPLVLPVAPGSRFDVGLDFGYGAATRARFRDETGLPGPYRDPDNPETSTLIHSPRWDQWRREKVTEVVARIGEALDEARPGLLLSAAVIPFADRAYLALAQDWRFWLEDRLVDFVVPMIYTRDDRLLRYQADSFGRGPFAARIWAGLGVWLFSSEPARAVEQLEIARASGLAGDALFSYDALAAAPGLYDALVANVKQEKTGVR